MAIWSNNYHQPMTNSAFQFNQSITIDDRLLTADLKGSIAHAKMLGAQSILDKNEAATLVQELEKMLSQYQKGTLEIDYSEEDIHSFIEAELIRRLGKIGKKVHTGRSRNDQVAIALKIYTLEEILELKKLILKVIKALCEKAQEHLHTVMPAYTHLQRAQAVTYGHYLMAYVEMMRRDVGRLLDLEKRIQEGMPLGSGALATSTFPLDREYMADELGFTSPSLNSIDGVSDRDYSIEMLGVLSTIVMHLSRYAEETILWTSQEFQFIQLADSYSTGSSIMPQKKNADVHELIRGKTGRVYGDLMNVMIIMKGLPLAYNKDMQEEKEALFDATDTVKLILSLIPGALEASKINQDRMYQAANEGFLNATDCADYLTSKGLPFREAYQITGNILAYCHEQEKTLETLNLAEYQKYSDLFTSDIYEVIDLTNCVYRRRVMGGPAPERVQEHIDCVTKWLNQL